MGRNLLLQILKMIGVLLLFALLMIMILVAFPSLTGPVESTSSYSVSNVDSTNASSQSAVTGSESYSVSSDKIKDGGGDSSASSQSALSGSGEAKNALTSASQQETVHTVTHTSTEETLRKEYMWIVWAGAFVLTFAAFLIDASNRTQRYKAEIPNRAANIVASTKKSDRLISQANRVVDKYTVHEGDVIKAVAVARGGQSAASTNPAAVADQAVSDAVASAVPQFVHNSSDFRAVIERYPTLQAVQNTQLLLSQLERCEADIVREKNAYNDAVAKYNTEIHTFPFSILRRALKLTDYENYTEHAVSNFEITDEMLGI